MLAEWLAQPAEVDRIVNYLYLLVVCLISIGVAIYALATKNRNAVRMYLYAIPVWLGIEGLGLTTGWRTYSEPVWLIYLIVSIAEDAGWVCLAYILSERLYGLFFRRSAGRTRQIGENGTQ